MSSMYSAIPMFNRLLRNTTSERKVKVRTLHFVKFLLNRTVLKLSHMKKFKPRPKFSYSMSYPGEIKLKLSGWQIIGVILSVLWVLLVCGAATYDYKVERGLGGGFGFAEPASSTPTPFTGVLDKVPVVVKPFTGQLDPVPATAKEFTGELDPVRKELHISRALTISLVPIFSAWVLFYVAIFVGRWIRNGFRGQ